MTNFALVTTLEELDALDPADIIEGYRSADRFDPEPGANRGKAFWHGWCNRQRDYGLWPQCEESRALVHAYVARNRAGENPVTLKAAS